HRRRPGRSMLRRAPRARPLVALPEKDRRASVRALRAPLLSERISRFAEHRTRLAAPACPAASEMERRGALVTDCWRSIAADHELGSRRSAEKLRETVLPAGPRCEDGLRRRRIRPPRGEGASIARCHGDSAAWTSRRGVARRLGREEALFTACFEALRGRDARFEDRFRRLGCEGAETRVARRSFRRGRRRRGSKR